jgi:hypothetical protein
LQVYAYFTSYPNYPTLKRILIEKFSKTKLATPHFQLLKQN